MLCQALPTTEEALTAEQALTARLIQSTTQALEVARISWTCSRSASGHSIADAHLAAYQRHTAHGILPFEEE